ncbi:hypothetical protein GLOTRDRAFT_79187 [Gloeophyllum trabeum ATCC 11539]|uniref:Protein kinase domain-containing protein n=1 Tax=Gloeophyllum trabeum (strain ATCC 11539 / FP-39264 / Madison 617) TaxID=670483 RepID=S7PZM8_GLOTA|nr:uncharacterized protein GLOTRDRAFT_79187 [Gloeophyllum trabeum ATCC 11539]EPQ53121.1 hypothetical protein GLOTRDRAFT_79187 [Gloeophyllum trabeum ATCC 11539]
MVTVAAKTAFPAHDPRWLIRNEARTYDKFPQHLQEEWCGYNLVTPIRYPVPVGAVVPKFYGYYEPFEQHAGPHKAEWEKRSPILLLEECGSPIEPKNFSLDERAECYSLLLRLHLADFVQNSFYVRNILVQPGPLTAPPEKRTMSKPSFRIIDFGRAQYFPPEVASDKKKWDEFKEARVRETRKAMEELEFEHGMLT